MSEHQLSARYLIPHTPFLKCLPIVLSKEQHFGLPPVPGKQAGVHLPLEDHWEFDDDLCIFANLTPDPNVALCEPWFAAILHVQLSFWL